MPEPMSAERLAEIRAAHQRSLYESMTIGPDALTSWNAVTGPPRRGRTAPRRGGAVTATETRQHPRAGKRVGDVDWEHVSRTPLLRLHGAFILGIVDPVPMPSPMSEEDGQWIREHAWTKAIRDIDDVYPYGFYRWCSCQRGSCWNCLSLRCDICVHRQTPPKPDTSAGTVTDRHGFVIALIVHRAGETPCRWVCKCAHSAVSAAAPAPDMPAPSPPRRTSRRPVEPVAGQADLFEAVGR